MKVSKLRIFYIVSLVILGALLVFTVFKPMATGEEYSEVQRAGLLKGEDQWILQFDILNREGRDTTYDITVYLEGTLADSQRVLIWDGGMFRYNYGIDFDWIKREEGEVTFTIYKEGEATPFEQATYYLEI